MPSIVIQIKALFRKNMMCSIRDKEYISEFILPLVTAIIISLKEQLQFLGFFAPMFLAVAVNSAPRSLLIHLVEEKSERFKETQKIMGMKQRAYTIGWILYGYFKTLLSTLVLLMFWAILNWIINDGDYGFQVHIAELFLTYIVYATATLNQSLALSTVFSDPKLASEVTTFMTILSILLSLLVLLNNVQSSLVFYVLMSIFPPAGISFAYMGAGNPGGFFNSLIISETYSLGDAALQLGIESILYFILYFYLDQVYPNEYGVAKHSLFFIKDLFNKQQVQPIEQGLLNNNAITDEDHSSAIYHQTIKNNKRSTVIISGLTKKFGNFTAVDKLSINLYESEILCLLGHNGAGKTTTISMLTGMIEKTAGQIIINGQELEQNIDAIRENVGICTQRDVLYEQLSVYEQLEYMGQIKGLQGQMLDKDINEILQLTELDQERNKLIKILSGGNKRKLSLAMALIGGSSVIFLDEPTSGMDAMSRRIIWEILMKVKKLNRTLVLTTHHLDEAEILADRIAIMAAGKLLACGKCEYIKTNFGEGQTMILTTQDDTIKFQLKESVSKHLPMAILDPQSSNDTLLYQIPTASKPQLLKFFAEIDNNCKGSVTINLKMNSLEDAFVNIGMDEEKFIKKARMYKGSVNQDDDEHEQPVHDEPIEQAKQIHIPDCLNRPPQYIFKQQFLAIFYRKWFTTTRTFSNYIAIVIPFALIVIGTLVINEINFDFLPDERVQYFKLVLISLFVILAFCFNSSLFITLPVLEREFNLKYALTVMGCKMMPYWLGTYAFDYILYSMFVILFVVFSYIMQLDFITDHMLLVVFTFINFGLAYVSFSYFAGILLYQKTSAAMKSFPLLNFFIVYCMPQNFWGIAALFYQKQIGNKAAAEFTIYVIEVIFSFISPFFSFQRAFQNIIKIDVQLDDAPPSFTTSSIYYSMALLYQGILYFLLTLYLETRYNEVQFRRKIEAPLDLKKSIREETRIQSSDDPIKVLGLQKRYDDGCMAIKDVSLGVQQSSILGLLGPNGAGKSTMFSILTSLIPKSSGNVIINNMEVERGNSEIFRNVGICPQFDCIWENLTPVEHLYLFGRMKGLSGTDLDESVLYFIQTMQLDEYVNRQAGKLSGGNKRKLCVSNALIGGPSIQFFDEPSTGVDPIARRFLWKTLKLGVQMRKSSVVITTHTMDEAESLCDRIAILINGQVYCLGSPQELRNKFGEGYNVILINHKDKAGIIKSMKQICPSILELEEQVDESLTLHIQSNEFEFYKVYKLLHQMAIDKLVTDFTICQSSLESVFLQFSKQQNVSD